MLARFVIVGLLFCFSVFSAKAQETKRVTDPTSLYQEAILLYDKEKFAAADALFERYSMVGDEQNLLVSARYYRSFCAMYLQAGDAEYKIVNTLTLYPEHFLANQAGFILGSFYYKKSNFNKTIELLAPVDELELKDAERKDYYFMLGYSYYFKEKYSEARPLLEKLQAGKDKYFYPSNYYLGFIALAEGRDDRAIDYFNKLTRSKVYGEEVTLLIARLYYKKGAYQEVISYTDSLSNHPAWTELAWERAKACYQLKKYKEAINQFDYTKEKKDLSPEDRYMLGMSYYRIGDYEKAFPYLTQVNPEAVELRQSAMMYAGDCFLRLKKNANARNAFSEAARLNADAALKEEATFLFAKLSLEPPFQQEAVGALNKFLELYPSSVFADEARGLLGQALLSSRRYADAIPVMESIRVKNDQIKTLYQEVCYYYASELMRQDPKEALKYFGKARTYPMNPRFDAQIDFWEGEILFENGDKEKARKNWERFVNNPASIQTEVYADGLYNLGYAYFLRQEYAKAQPLFKRYVDRESYGGEKKAKYLDGMTRLADCHMVARNYTAAFDAFAYVSSKEAPNSDYAWFQQGMIRGLQNKLEEKIQLLRKIPSRMPNSEYVDDALFEIALVHLQRKAYEEALRGFSFLLEDYPNGIYAKRSHLNKGLILYNLKRYDEAIASYKYVVEQYPRSIETEEAIYAVENIYSEQGRADELLPWLKGKKEVRASYEDSILYNSALKWYREKNCDRSIRDFKNYLQRFPNGYFAIEAGFYASECLFLNNQFEDALSGYLKAIDKNHPDFMEVSLRQSSAIYLWKKEDNKALPLLLKLEQQATGRDNIIYAHLNLMNTLQRMQRLSEAKVYAEKVLENEKAQKSDLTEARLIMGRYAIQVADYPAAKKYFTTVEKDAENRNRRGAEAKYWLAFIDFKNNQIKSAQQMVFDLDEKYANQVYWVAMGYALLGETYLVQKDYFNARAVLQSLLDNYANDGDGLKEKVKELMGRLEVEEKTQ